RPACAVFPAPPWLFRPSPFRLFPFLPWLWPAGPPTPAVSAVLPARGAPSLPGHAFAAPVGPGVFSLLPCAFSRVPARCRPRLAAGAPRPWAEAALAWVREQVPAREWAVVVAAAAVPRGAARPAGARRTRARPPPRAG